MKKIVMVVILGLLTNLIPFGPAMAQEKVQDKDSKHAEKIKKAVADAGPTLDREVIVKLKDNTEVRGFIREIADDHFIVKSNSGALSTISYSQVEKFKANKRDVGGRGFMTGPSSVKKVIGGFAIGLGVLIIACVASRRCEE
jgi:small nuclear ribonucleoprotein (snRNP)-like protein